MPQTWKKFILATRDKKPNPFLIRAIRLASGKNRKALDLGAGGGSTARFLAKNGFEVDAVDISPESIRELRKLSKNLKINVARKDISEFYIDPGSYDVIVAWNSLPFLKKAQAEKVLRSIRVGLKKRGIAVVSVFGPKDEWAINGQVSFFDTPEIKKLFFGLDLLEISEIKKSGPTIVGRQKLWHILRLVVRRA